MASSVSLCKTESKDMKLMLYVIWALLSVALTLLIVSSSFYARNVQRKLTLGGIIVSVALVLLFLGYFLKIYGRSLKQDIARAIDDINHTGFLSTVPGIPTRFSFEELQSITQNFSNKLGKGGSGSVFHGELPDGTPVAVKRLERETRSDKKQFYSEVSTISKIRQVNLVSLKGFCAENGHRMLVYECMPNGSLEKWIFDSPARGLNWNIRFEIALGTARALAYLHEECEERILHLDVKPQNILLDEMFRPKVSDFGLSRSMGKDESMVVTTMRGTPGYFAPEWLSGIGIDNKTDVYSFGMVLLELVSGRRSVDQTLPDPKHWFLPAMAFKKAEQNLPLEIVDPVIKYEIDDVQQMQAQNVILVALWCIQEDANVRPMMSTVVQMLEGIVEVSKPPLPSMFSTKPKPIMEILDVSTTGTENSSSSDVRWSLTQSGSNIV